MTAPQADPAEEVEQELSTATQAALVVALAAAVAALVPTPSLPLGQAVSRALRAFTAAWEAETPGVVTLATTRARELADAHGVTLDDVDTTDITTAVGRDLDGIASAVRRAVGDERDPGAVREALDPERHRSLAERFASTTSTMLAGWAINAVANVIPGGTRTWRSARDQRVRPAHAAIDGVTRRAGTDFVVGNERTPYPGHPRLSPANRIGCRCRLTLGRR